MIDSVGKSYAKALMDLSSEEGFYKADHDKVFNELNEIKKILNDKNILKFLTHPSIELKIKHEIIETTLKDFSQVTKSFMNILIENKRLVDFDEICEAYQKLLDEEKGIVRVEIITNVELAETVLKKIIKMLETTYQKKVIASTKIVPDLIGGIICKRDGFVIDSSLLNKLKSIKDAILYSD